MTTLIRLGEHGALWHCTRCDAAGHRSGPWHLVEQAARHDAAVHHCEPDKDRK